MHVLKELTNQELLQVSGAGVFSADKVIDAMRPYLAAATQGGYLAHWQFATIMAMNGTWEQKGIVKSWANIYNNSNVSQDVRNIYRMATYTFMTSNLIAIAQHGGW